MHTLKKNAKAIDLQIDVIINVRKWCVINHGKKNIFINHIVEVISIVRAVQPTYGTNPPIPTDQFNPKIGWSDTYDSLRQFFALETNPGELLHENLTPTDPNNLHPTKVSIMLFPDSNQ